MQTVKQSKKNDAGAPMDPYRGPSGTQISRNGYNLYFPDFLNKFETNRVSGLATVSLEIWNDADYKTIEKK